MNDSRTERRAQETRTRSRDYALFLGICLGGLGRDLGGLYLHKCMQLNTSNSYCKPRYVSNFATKRVQMDHQLTLYINE